MAKVKEEEEKRNGRFVGAAETSGELAKFLQKEQDSAKKLEHIEPRKGKEWLIATKQAVDKYTKPVFAKGKRKKSICPDHQIMRWERESR